MNKDEPETSLEYLKKVEDTLKKLESKGSSVSSQKDDLDPNYHAALSYNMACCYQRLGMLEECVDYLELATKALNKKIIQLEEEEKASLFLTTTNTGGIGTQNTTSLEGELSGPNNQQNPNTTK